MTVPARHPEVTVIEPATARRFVDVRELWRYRAVTGFLVWRDYKLRYRQTALGIIWVVLQPLATLAVFSIVLGELAGVPTDGVPYPLLALSGLVVWGVFAQGLAAAAASLLGNRELVAKVYFPRLSLPLASVLSASLNLGPNLVLLVVVMAGYGEVPPVQVVLLPLFVVMALAAAVGLGAGLAATAVKYRDVNHIVPFLVQTLLFLTPVAYPASLVSGDWDLVYGLNPMAGVVDGVRWSLLGTRASWPGLAVSVAATCVVVALGLAHFRRTEQTFADLI